MESVAIILIQMNLLVNLHVTGMFPSPLALSSENELLKENVSLNIRWEAVRF